MRHRGSAMGSWGAGLDCGALVDFGAWVWFGFAGFVAIEAHIVHALAVIGVACVAGSWVCGWGADGVFFSSSLSFLVKYTLVSARYAMVGSTGFFVSSL